MARTDGFDYDVLKLSETDRKVVEGVAHEVRRLLRLTTAQAIAIGREFAKAKALLPQAFGR